MVSRRSRSVIFLVALGLQVGSPAALAQVKPPDLPRNATSPMTPYAEGMEKLREREAMLPKITVPRTRSNEHGSVLPGSDKSPADPSAPASAPGQRPGP
jgi:hypothetical protein